MTLYSAHAIDIVMHAMAFILSLYLPPTLPLFLPLSLSPFGLPSSLPFLPSRSSFMQNKKSLQ